MIRAVESVPKYPLEMLVPPPSRFSPAGNGSRIKRSARRDGKMIHRTGSHNSRGLVQSYFGSVDPTRLTLHDIACVAPMATHRACTPFIVGQLYGRTNDRSSCAQGATPTVRAAIVRESRSRLLAWQGPTREGSAARSAVGQYAAPALPGAVEFPSRSPAPAPRAHHPHDLRA